MNKLLTTSFLLSFLFLSISSFCQNTSSNEKASNEVALDVYSDIKSSYVGDRKSGFFYGFREDGKTLIPFEYEELPEKLASLMRAKKDNKYGIISSKNELIAPFIYDELPYTLVDYMVVQIGEKKGLIDIKGQVIIPVEYDEVSQIPFRKGIYVAMNQTELTEFDTKGNIEKSNYTYFKNYRFKKFISVGNKNGKYGIVDYQNKEIVPFIYDCPLESFRIIDGVYQWKTCKDKRYGVIDMKNQLILAFEYENIEETFFTSWFQIKEGDKVGVINEKGENIVPIEYDKTNSIGFNRGRNRLVVVVKDKLKGIYNEMGKIIVPLEYDYIKLIENKFIKVGKGDKFGLFDTNGKLVLPCEFGKNIKYRSSTVTAQRDLERVGRYSSVGKLIPTKEFEFKEKLGYYTIVANSDESGTKKGLIDRVGNLVVKPNYDSFSVQKIESIGYNFFIFEQEGKFAFAVDNLLPEIQAMTKFLYTNLAFGIYKKDGKKLAAKEQTLKDIIGYSLSADKKERTYITISAEEILIK